MFASSCGTKDYGNGMTSDQGSATRRFSIRLGGDDLVFCAAHLAVWSNGEGERLHGHSFRVSAVLGGPLDRAGCVVDFLVARRELRSILAELDHRVLLPRECPGLRIEAAAGQVHASLADRRWSFPADDCLLVPLANTSTEMLAEYIGRRLLDALAAAGHAAPLELTVEIGEGSGCSALAVLSAGA
jgi:6-pyruvoyltetrahydropterin/6-carboxytetrahydropterin synthase